MQDIMDHQSYYISLSNNDLKLKEARLARLPDMKDIFELAFDCLNQGDLESSPYAKKVLYVRAAALALLSLIPLRNEDTVLLWGEHISFVGVNYRINAAISKTNDSLKGKLNILLTPFFDRLILLGRDRRMLPQLRKEAELRRAPVFPKSDSSARSAQGLSRIWAKVLGTGSIISRTRVHTLLGELGRAASRQRWRCAPTDRRRRLPTTRLCRSWSETFWRGRANSPRRFLSVPVSSGRGSEDCNSAVSRAASRSSPDGCQTSTPDWSGPLGADSSGEVN